MAADTTRLTIVLAGVDYQRAARDHCYAANLAQLTRDLACLADGYLIPVRHDPVGYCPPGGSPPGPRRCGADDGRAA